MFRFTIATVALDTSMSGTLGVLQNPSRSRPWELSGIELGYPPLVATIDGLYKAELNQRRAPRKTREVVETAALG